jgi:hypothetical protein
MKHHTKFSYLRTGLLPILVCLVAVGGLLLGAQPASAQTTCTGVAGDPSTCYNAPCMGDLLFPPPTTQKLNCTAEDVRLGFADNVRNLDGSALTSCTQGTFISFTADFHVVEGSTALRHDVGLYFSTDQDPNNDGAQTGTCAVSKISSTNTIPTSAFFNPDASPDSCGDMSGAHRTMVVGITLNNIACQPGPLFFNPTTGLCQATEPFPGADHCVSLPNCVSWREPGSNQVCDSPLDAFPANKAKCTCDKNFGIPITVEEEAELIVTKVASPDTVPEGGTTHYTVTVTNPFTALTVTIDSIIDDVYGNLGTNTPSQTNNTCPSLIGMVLTTSAPGNSASCGFDVGVGNIPPNEIIDIVEVCGTDSEGRSTCGNATETVTITDVPVAPSLSKTALSAAVVQVDVNYEVVVTNHSASDTLTVNSLTDTVFGDITQQQGNVVSPCTLSQNPIPAGGNATCRFVGRHTTTGTHINTLTGTATDQDGVVYNPTTTPPLPTDDASVTISFSIP